MNTNLTNNRLYEFLPSPWGEVDMLVKEFFGPQVSKGLKKLPKQGPAGYSAASVWEDDSTYHVELDVPGVSREDVELTYEPGELQIAWERKAPQQRNGMVDGRVYGTVKRTLCLPDSANPESIEANLTQGVLHVSVAKIPAVQPKRIEVK